MKLKLGIPKGSLENAGRALDAPAAQRDNELALWSLLHGSQYRDHGRWRSQRRHDPADHHGRRAGCFAIARHQSIRSGPLGGRLLDESQVGPGADRRVPTSTPSRNGELPGVHQVYAGIAGQRVLARQGARGLGPPARNHAAIRSAQVICTANTANPGSWKPEPFACPARPCSRIGFYPISHLGP
jgi:hypothetical protein